MSVLPPLGRTCLLAVGVATAVAAQQPVRAPAATDRVPLLDDLGTLHRPVTTRVALAQRYFDQGLRLQYAFNHPEAVRAFREAQRLDPTCASCFWGEALALGPNINAPMPPSANAPALAALRRAEAASGDATAIEQALIRALGQRYVADRTDRPALDSAYASAMGTLAARYPDDLDVLALAAEAQMVLAPWNYWTPDAQPRPGTRELVGWLEAALARDAEHPGACHYLIHAVEAADPARAVRCAERLAQLMPGAGHIVHMPAHIYVRVGRWAEAIASNRHALHADETFFAQPGAERGGSYEAGYYAHNWHFLAFAAAMAGASAVAEEASRKAVEGLTPELARQVAGVETILPLPFTTAALFARWDDVLQLPLPPSDLLLASGIAHYSRGVALAATGRGREARASLDSVRAFRERADGDSRTTLAIAADVLEADLLRRAGDFAAAVALLQHALALESELPYMEPPTWYQPVRHALGQAQLEARRPVDAERTYREDLARFPENGWSLFGLKRALEMQGRRREARDVARRLAVAWRTADVTLTGTRF